MVFLYVDFCLIVFPEQDSSVVFVFAFVFVFAAAIEVEVEIEVDLEVDIEIEVEIEIEIDSRVSRWSELFCEDKSRQIHRRHSLGKSTIPSNHHPGSVDLHLDFAT
jgi:hypothetical protein